MILFNMLKVVIRVNIMKILSKKYGRCWTIKWPSLSSPYLNKIRHIMINFLSAGDRKLILMWLFFFLIVQNILLLLKGWFSHIEEFSCTELLHVKKFENIVYAIYTGFAVQLPYVWLQILSNSVQCI